ncbi:Short chain dehydrogenase atnD [Hyphodiscus hymeniophilus]|uniref:Short chain dehydrogenase atnD n=1 Tax=Hyphodiscus hymeniophilus TaxID=353542 RepID=A0A9P7AUN6_9HELO|nr:Short chain dehydrogenase atnD [Hyphodiscus hymeniophilus]
MPGPFNLPNSFLTTFLKSQFADLPYPTHSFASQTIVVTGANTGLGLEAARHFVRLGAAKVILGCRSLDKGFDAKKDIKHSYQVSECIIEVWEVDLESYASVKAFCLKVGELERVDVVLENAGVATPKFELCEGMEKTITVNVVSTFLMALLVLPKLRESAVKYGTVPRLTIVASDAHEQANFKDQSAPNIFEALKSDKHQPDRYNISKLLEILTVRGLAPAMTASGKPKVVLNTLTPGFCHSELMRHATLPLKVMGGIGKKLIGRTSEVGSRTLVAAACAGDETHGTYMMDCQVGEVSAWVRSDKGKETQDRVYNELLGVLEGIEPGITKNI